MYSIVDLGTLGGQTSYASKINEREQVVGRSETGRSNAGHLVVHAFLWQKGHMQDIGAFAGLQNSYATGINNKGEVVGYVVSPVNSIVDVEHAFLWKRGKATYLRPLPGCRESHANGINDAGVVVGYCAAGTMDRHNEEIAYACRWDTGKVSALGALGGDYSYANAINNAGVIVGKADIEDGRSTRACLWRQGKVTDLGAPSLSLGQALNVSDNSYVVGYFHGRAGGNAFIWRMENMQTLQLPIDNKETGSIAMDVNDRGEVVGYANSPQGLGESVLLVWRKGQIQELNELIPVDAGWVLETANSINNLGEIIGYGNHNNEPHAFLLKINTIFPK